MCIDFQIVLCFYNVYVQIFKCFEEFMVYICIYIIFMYFIMRFYIQIYYVGYLVYLDVYVFMIVDKICFRLIQVLICYLNKI